MGFNPLKALKKLASVPLIPLKQTSNLVQNGWGSHVTSTNNQTGQVTTGGTLLGPGVPPGTPVYNAVGLANAGPIAGPMAPFRQTQGLPMTPGVNPFLGAAAKANMNVNQSVNPMATQTAMASALRGEGNGE